MLIELQLHVAGNFVIPVTVKPCMGLLWVSSKWHRWKSNSSWADQSTQAACMKGNQRSKKISFCLRITLGIWISISANVFLCSAPRPSSCYSATSRLILAPQERSQQTDSSASSSATGWESLSKHGQRGQGRPPVLTLPDTRPVGNNTDLLHQLPLLARQRKGHKNQCRWGAWTQDFKEEAISPGPSFCISPPLVQTTP